MRQQCTTVEIWIVAELSSTKQGAQQTVAELVAELQFSILLQSKVS